MRFSFPGAQHDDIGFCRQPGALTRPASVREPDQRAFAVPQRSFLIGYFPPRRMAETALAAAEPDDCVQGV
jgi:hypothetical protein